MIHRQLVTSRSRLRTVPFVPPTSWNWYRFYGTNAATKQAKEDVIVEDLSPSGDSIDNHTPILNAHDRVVQSPPSRLRRLFAQAPSSREDLGKVILKGSFKKGLRRLKLFSASSLAAVTTSMPFLAFHASSDLPWATRISTTSLGTCLHRIDRHADHSSCILILQNVMDQTTSKVFGVSAMTTYGFLRLSKVYVTEIHLTDVKDKRNLELVASGEASVDDYELDDDDVLTITTLDFLARPHYQCIALRDLAPSVGMIGTWTNRYTGENYLILQEDIQKCTLLTHIDQRIRLLDALHHYDE